SGSIRIRSSVGKGTTVTISLPLTMAIIPAVMVEVSSSTLAIPLSSVKEVLKVGEAEMKSVGTSPAIRLRDEVLAVVHLRQALKLGSNGNGSQDHKTPVVIVDYEEKKVGLGVDRVIGTGEIVIKSLGRHYREIEGLIGASILGNGRIALIVDVEALVRQYYHAEGAEHTFTGSSIFNYQEKSRGPIEAETVQKEDVNAAQGEDEVDGVSEEEVHVDGAAEGSEDVSVMEEVAPEPAGTEPLEGLTEELNEGRGALLEEIHNAGAIQASMALSKLTEREVRVSFPESQLVQLGEIADFLGGEEKPVGGLYVGIEGSLEGGILIVMPVENMLKFHDQLYRQTPGTCSSLEEVDMSGISELGNILAASFISAISDGTGLGVKSDPPEISVDMCQPVIDSVLARFNQPGDRILFTKALIYCDESEEVVCHLLMFLEPESLKKLIVALVDNLE
ncbi:MAG: chemotaxis protein CheW, partial [Spirochaetia bacterium]